MTFVQPGDPVMTGDGRVVITEIDDRDTAFPLVTSQPANILSLNAFSEVIRLEMVRARRGQLILSANIVTTGSFANQYVYIDTMVVAYLASSPIVVFRTALDANLNLATWTWDPPETYGSLGIWAQEVVDGSPSSVSTGITTLQLSVAGFYWR